MQQTITRTSRHRPRPRAAGRGPFDRAPPASAGWHGAPGEFSMSMRMLIDARHPEETRVAVVKGNRIEEFDFESAEHKQLKGNIYLAKVTRVEPSLQAAFIDYGGNRHGFLAFSEIHPDYYQIPKADRDALLREEAEHAAEEERLRARRISTTTRTATSTKRRDDESDDDDGDDNGDRATTKPAEAGTGSAARRSTNAPPTSCAEAPGPAPPLQDPGRHPAPPGAAGPGRQGRARQQGRGADHLSQPRRPLLRADAQHQPRRRHQPEDLQRRRPQAAEVDHGRPEPAVDHGPDRPHRRPVAHQGRDQARLRLSRPAVGRDPRAHARAAARRRSSIATATSSSARSATSITAKSTKSWSRARKATRRRAAS